MDTYEKKYKEALERAKKANKCEADDREPSTSICEYIFPELTEFEDEKIRKSLIILLQHFCKGYRVPGLDFPVSYKDMLAWLEKQGEQKPQRMISAEAKEAMYNKPSDKIKPKFKVDDWVVYYRNDSSREVLQVYDIRDGRYYFTDNVHFSWSVKECDEKSHLWTIQDAKEGDVLYHENKYNGIEFIVMNKGINECGNIDSYFRYNSSNGFGIDIPSVLSVKCDNITPATKEQRNLLFQKMHEAGYEWDTKNNVLKEIPNAFEKCEIVHVEHGKYYYCIKDYYAGGNKRASKGDVVQALNGMSMMALGVKANEYFIPVNTIKQMSDWSEDETSIAIKNPDAYKIGFADGEAHAKEEMQSSWSEEDKNFMYDTLSNLTELKYRYGEGYGNVGKCIDWLKSLKTRYTWKPSDEQLEALKNAIHIKPFKNPSDSILWGLYEQLNKLKS